MAIPTTLIPFPQGNSPVPRPIPSYVLARALAASVAESFTVPTTMVPIPRYVIFSCTANFYANCYTTATVPADVTDGTASELAPVAYQLTPDVTTISVISPIGLRHHGELLRMTAGLVNPWTAAGAIDSTAVAITGVVTAQRVTARRTIAARSRMQSRRGGSSTSRVQAPATNSRALSRSAPTRTWSARGSQRFTKRRRIPRPSSLRTAHRKSLSRAFCSAVRGFSMCWVSTVSIRTTFPASSET
jgi:hypothetical protein